MEEEKFDYIVIGAGVNGSWTAYHLSKRGFKVLLLDQVCIHTIFMLSFLAKMKFDGTFHIIF